MTVGLGSQVEQLVLAACSSREFPEERDFAERFLESDGRFLSYEGSCWDFKRTWPASYSDEYFQTLTRAVVGFANAQGGFLVFGVDDKERTGGHNVSTVDADRFTQAIAAIVGEKLDLRFRTYALASVGEVVVLLIPPRAFRTTPLRLLDPKTNKTVTWIRDGHQIVAASPRHFDLLFLRSGDSVADVERQLTTIEVAIPPSPATVRKFVGRTQAMIDLFEWVFAEHRPRVYLFGKGGSGKSTIAWEFARLIQSAPDLRLFNSDDTIDAVIFLTAKEKALNTIEAATEATRPDFSDKDSLFRALLSHSGWVADHEELAKWSSDYLRKELTRYFNEFSAMIIIDDIDTLTTKGLDSGDEDLFYILSRAKRTSKILYTLRNAPAPALGSAIEVPGLEIGGEYEEFVELCAKHFGVPKPTAHERDMDLAKATERRPLVVESIFALRRTTSNLQQALQLFRTQAGSDIRKYVFVREWEAIRQPADGRLVLTALALMGRPALFEELETILQIPDDRIRDGIAQVRNMFLEVSHLGDQTKFGMAALTRAFVLENATALDQFLAIKTRVRDFASKTRSMTHGVAHVAARVEACFSRSSDQQMAAQRAMSIVSDVSLPVEVREDSDFRAVFGYVHARQPNPRLAECRSAFQSAMQMRREIDVRYLRAWYHAERESQIGYEYCRKICDYVLEHRGYSAEEKRDFLLLKATSTYYRARANQQLDMATAMSGFFDALTLHLMLFRWAEEDNCNSARTALNARNTCYSWLLVGGRLGRLEELLASADSLLRRPDIYADPIEEPLLQFLAYGGLARGDRGELHRRARLLDELVKTVYMRKCWADRAAASRVSSAINETASAVKAALR